MLSAPFSGGGEGGPEREVPTLTAAGHLLILRWSTAQACKHIVEVVKALYKRFTQWGSLRQEILEQFEVQKQHSTPHSPKAQLLHQARSPAFIY